MSEVPAKYDASTSQITIAEFSKKACTRLFIDPEYSSPLSDDIKQLRDLMGWSQTDIAKMTGVNFSKGKGSTTVRKWCASTTSNEHRQIPYSAWRLLLIYAGLAKPDEYKRQK